MKKKAATAPETATSRRSAAVDSGLCSDDDGGETVAAARAVEPPPPHHGGQTRRRSGGAEVSTHPAAAPLDRRGDDNDDDDAGDEGIRPKDPPPASASWGMGGGGSGSNDDDEDRAGRRSQRPRPTASIPSMEEMVENLARDPELVRIIERGVAAMMMPGGPKRPSGEDGDDNDNEEDSKPAAAAGGAGASGGYPRDEVSKRVVKAVLLERLLEEAGLPALDGLCARHQGGRNLSQNRPSLSARGQRPHRRHRRASSMRSSSRSRSPLSLMELPRNPNGGGAKGAFARRGRPTVTLGRRAIERDGSGRPKDGKSLLQPLMPLPVKSVSFSTISVPDDRGGTAGNVGGYAELERDRRRFRRPSSSSPPRSPPPPPSPPPMGGGGAEGTVSASVQFAQGITSPPRSPPPPPSPPPMGGGGSEGTVLTSVQFAQSITGGTQSAGSSPVAFLPPSPMRSSNHGRHGNVGYTHGAATIRSRSRSRSPTNATMSSVTSAQTGESTADESSVASFYTGTVSAGSVSRQRSVTIAPRLPQVHFSAMNPNPHLDLDANTEGRNAGYYGGGLSGPRVVSFWRDTAMINDDRREEERQVAFTDPPNFERTVSWEDQNYPQSGTGTGNGSSRVSVRSGMSSPSVDIAPSPPLSRSRSPTGIQFNSVIETITEAAARLRNEHQEMERGGVGSSHRLVHFSAMRDVAVVDTDVAAAESINSDGADRRRRGRVHSMGASPPMSRSRSPTGIQFNSVIETITEAAARLRNEHQEMERRGVGSSHRLVHFSAMRDVAVVETDVAAAESINSDGADPRRRGRAHSAGNSHAPRFHLLNSARNSDYAESSVSSGRGVCFAGEGNGGGNHSIPSSVSSASSSLVTPLLLSTENQASEEAGRRSFHDINRRAETQRAADQLRRIIRRAKEAGDVTLEGAFAHFDQNHTGNITAANLRAGLMGLGESFAAFSLEDCEALIECLLAPAATNAVRGLGGETTDAAAAINLLGFYRAMGRRSPPLLPISDDERSTPASIDGSPLEGSDSDEEDRHLIEARGREGADAGPPSALYAHLSRQRRYRSGGGFPAGGGDLARSPVVHAHEAASRLREIVLSAEREDGIPLESSFRILDPSGTGYITARDFHMGLRRLGRRRSEPGDGNILAEYLSCSTPFSSIDSENCEELVTIFDTNGDGLVSLLDFYRFMGRRSPPPSVVAVSNSGSGIDSLSDNVVGEYGNENEEGAPSSSSGLPSIEHSLDDGQDLTLQ